MTPRIDTVRNQLDATIELLQRARANVDDLHVLAYDRPAARDRAHVRGGLVDYALDTHGDPRARDALTALKIACDAACAELGKAAHEAIALIREGETARTISPKRVSDTEFADALEAQARRRQRGEYSPHRTEPQPRP